MPLFEVAILELPKKGKKDDEGNEVSGQERIVLGPVSVIARDSQTAAITAVMDAKDINVDRSRMQVLVRPFA